MPSQVKPVPEGFHTVTPAFAVKDAAKAIDFYKKAFGAQEISRMSTPDGRIMHAEIKIGDSIIMLAEEFPGMGGTASPQTLGNTTVNLHIYVPDVDAAFDRAVKAGAKHTMPVADMFWGDRYGKLLDPFGHAWSIGTHKEDVSQSEMERRGNELFKQMAAQRKSA